jgi:hypothetical protein
MSKWLELLKVLGPVIIATTVPHGDLIAPAIVNAIAEAEQIKGATGPEKLAHVVAIASNTAQIAQTSGVNINPAAVAAATVEAINTTVAVINIIHEAQKPTTT